MYIPERSGSCGELKMAVDWKCQSNFQDDIKNHPGRLLRFKDVKCFKWRCFQSVNILKSIVPQQVSIIDLYSHLYSHSRSSGSKSQHQRPFWEDFYSIVLSFSPLKCLFSSLFFLTLASLRRRSLSVCGCIHPSVDGASPLMWGWRVEEWGGGRGGEMLLCSSHISTVVNYGEIWEIWRG